MYQGERINSISHLVGASLSLVGFVLLVAFSSLTGNPWKVVSCTIYGLTLLLMYIFSTLYHSFRGKPKEIFQVFDHIAIYLLIAGTYTPFALVTLRETTGWYIFSVVWTIAIVGIVLKSIWIKKYNLFFTMGYLVAGWTILPEITTIYQIFPRPGFYLMLSGGLCYTVGAIFYLIDRMPLNHEIWHFFVLAASILHYLAIFFYLI